VTSRREAAERYGISPSVGGDLGAAFRGDLQRCSKAKRRQWPVEPVGVAQPATRRMQAQTPLVLVACIGLRREA
jgi:hypothetical protein